MRDAAKKSVIASYIPLTRFYFVNSLIIVIQKYRCWKTEIEAGYVGNGNIISLPSDDAQPTVHFLLNHILTSPYIGRLSDILL